jgi:hypothetical protein
MSTTTVMVLLILMNNKTLLQSFETGMEYSCHGNAACCVILMKQHDLSF